MNHRERERRGEPPKPGEIHPERGGQPPDVVAIGGKMVSVDEILGKRLDKKNYKKVKDLGNAKLEEWLAKYIAHCNPDSVFICDDSKEDREHVRRMTLERGEEKPLATKGHTIHYDGVQDQGRDKEVTKYLVPEGVNLGTLNSIGKREGLEEMHGLLKGSMKGRQMIVKFATLGPKNGPFAIPGAQITDSYYVADSVDYLYRDGYEQFKRLKGGGDFFKVVHSTGELDESGCSRNPGKKRIYMDLEDNTVYSVNTQYAGNTVAFKKLSLRLAVAKADKEGWLAEHMLVMKDPETGVFVLGAYPSMCGKTSTAMMPGWQVVGDDIAYLRVINGEVRAVNVESGIFGIIKDINSRDDPLIWKLLTEEGRVIFVNVAVGGSNNPRWSGDGREEPEEATNHQGVWHRGDRDDKGELVPICHPNARYTVELHRLKNADVPSLEDPQGVKPSVILYGGRDSITTVPVEQALNWEQGVATKCAILESETTKATVGEAGVPVMDPGSMRDFVSIPLGRYIGNHLAFGKKAKSMPSIFSVNYFLREGGRDLTDKEDKRIWVKWAVLRARGDVDAIETPTGFIPRYEDLQKLFQRILEKEFTREHYDQLFTVRIPEWLAKIQRGVDLYQKSPGTPGVLLQLLEEQKQRLEKLRAKRGNYVKPDGLHREDWA